MGLDDEGISASHALGRTDVDFPVGEVVGVDGQELSLQLLRDFLRQLRMRPSGGEN
ncbi:hypothetical protein D3C85_1821580 [compost metagenome]